MVADVLSGPAHFRSGSAVRASGSNPDLRQVGSLDIVLAVILGSILSRALTANAPFLPTLAAAFTLLLSHCFLIRLSLLSKTMGHMVKGRETLLIIDGQIQKRELRRVGMTEHDLTVALRLNGGITSTNQAKQAFLERNGSVSVIT